MASTSLESSCRAVIDRQESWREQEAMLERYLYELLTWWEKQKTQVVEGQGLVEYALIIALVSIALIAALTALAGGIGNVFSTIQGALGGGGQ